jgi:hypothetical protein
MTPAAPAPDVRWHRRVIRNAVGSIAALALVGGLAATGVSAAAASTPGKRVSAPVAAADAFAALTTRLDSRQRSALMTGGLRLGELDDEQRASVMSLARSLLSDDGYAEFVAVMAADDALDAASGGGSEYGSDHWFVAAIEDPLGGSFIQLGGKQVAFNAILRDDTVTVEPELL